MPANRYYINTSLSTKMVEMTGDEMHHLVHVMRGKVGDTVELINGQGKLSQATISSISKQAVQLVIQSTTSHSFQSSLILAQALPRFSHLEWIVEKATELGVSEFMFFPGELSEKTDLSPNQLHRLNTLILAAVKQSGRLFLPKISIHPKLINWVPLLGTILYGDPGAQASIPSLKSEHLPVYFFIGPEKGFSAHEIKILQHNLMANSVKLNPNILRTETAGCAALAILSYLLCHEKTLQS